MGTFLNKAVWIAAGLTALVGIGVVWIYSNMNTAATAGSGAANKAFSNTNVTG